MKTFQRFVSACLMFVMILGNVPLAHADNGPGAPAGLSTQTQVPDYIQGAHDKMKNWIEPVCVQQSNGQMEGSDGSMEGDQAQMAAAMKGAVDNAKDRNLIQQGNQVILQVQHLLKDKYAYSKKRCDTLRTELAAATSDYQAINGNFSAAQNKKGEAFNANVSKNFCDKAQGSATSAKAHADAVMSSADEGVGETNELINKFGDEYYHQLQGISNQMTATLAQRKAFEACENSLLESTRSSTAHDTNNYDYGTVRNYYQQLSSSAKQADTSLADFTTKGKDCSGTLGALDNSGLATADGKVPGGTAPGGTTPAPTSGTNWGVVAMGAAVLGAVGVGGYFLGKSQGDKGGDKKSSDNTVTSTSITCPTGQYLSGSVCLNSPPAVTDGVANGTDSGTTTGTTATAANLGTAQNLTGANTLGNGSTGSNGTASSTRGGGGAVAAGTSSGSSGSSGSLGLTGGSGGTASTTRGLVASTGSSASFGGGYGGGSGFGGGGAAAGDQAAQGGMSLNSVDAGSAGQRVRVWKVVNGKGQWVWEVKGGCQTMKTCNDRRSKILNEASGGSTATAQTTAAPIATARALTASTTVSRSPASVSRAPAASTTKKKVAAKKSLVHR